MQTMMHILKVVVNFVSLFTFIVFFFFAGFLGSLAEGKRKQAAVALGVSLVALLIAHTTTVSLRKSKKPVLDTSETRS